MAGNGPLEVAVQYHPTSGTALKEAGEKVAGVLLAASGSKTVAAPKQPEVTSAQVIELESAPGEIARGLRPLLPR